MIDPATCDALKFSLYARHMEKRFCKVYENVISNYFVFNEDLISGAKGILNSKKERKIFKTDLPSYQLAFLLSFGVQDTCTVARKFFESIQDYTEVVKKLSKNNPIKLLCIESESLPAVIGVCQVINEIVKEFGSGGKFDFTEVRILVIDNREEWKRLCGYVIDTANSYFTNIELKDDFVEDFVTWSFQEFNDRIQELDFLVVARFFTEDRIFNYNLLRIVLNEMKEGAILFYFDSCNERFYANLKEISNYYSFSQIQNCQNLQASFEDLGDEQYYLDLPMSWDKDFQPIMFSTWIKDFAVQNDSFPEVVPIAFNKLNRIKSKKKSNTSALLTVSRCISNSEATTIATNEQTNIVISKKKAKSLAKQCNKSNASRGHSSTAIGKKQINDTTKQCNVLDTSREQMNLVNENEKAKSSGKNFAQSNSPREQMNVISGTKEIKTSTKYSNQSDSLSKQTKVITGKKKVKSLTKVSNPDISTIKTTKTGASKAKKEAHTQKTHEMIDNLLSILNKQTIDFQTPKPSQKSQCSNVPSEVAISQKVIAIAENYTNSVNELDIGSSISHTTQIIKPKKKTKAATSKISASTSKSMATNEGDQILITKPTVNEKVTSTVSQANGSQNKSKAKPSEKNTKKNTDAKSSSSKEEFKTKSINNKSSNTTTTPEVETEKSFGSNLPKKSSKKNTAKTKKSNTNNATEKIKLTGKFARMDLEKKNKDERHKMRAKKASFAKHANFDYDD